MSYINSWDNDLRSASYAKLEFPNTYYLAYRDLPEIIKNHAVGNRALDFGCGTGRSTRFLKKMGFDTVGIDISTSMIRKAMEQDPSGKYLQVKDSEYDFLPGKFDIIQSIFTFDNIPGTSNRQNILMALKEKLIDTGHIIMLDANSLMYTP